MNTRYRTIIIEDEKNASDTLRMMLEKKHPEIDVVATHEDVRTAAEYLRENKVDLAFMDVCIRGGTSFDILSQLPTIPFQIIFITAHNEYALGALKLSALDYLLKPIDMDELEFAIQKFISTQFDHVQREQQLQILREHLASAHACDGSVVIPTTDGYTVVPIQDIVRCEAQSNYTDIYLKDRTKLTACKTLREYEELFASHNFFRIHHSYIINLHHLRKYVKGKGGYVILSDGKELEVSVRKKEEFLHRLGA